MRKLPEPALRDQLITIPLMAGGMFLFVWLAGLTRGAWYSKVFMGFGWVCAIVGAATIVAVLERALSTGKRRR